jgi:hypothetical protein
MNYNMKASRELVAALGDIFPNGQRFDEYTIISHARELPLEFLASRRVPQRVAVATWLRSVADQNIGLSRDTDSMTWFRVCHAARMTDSCTAIKGTSGGPTGVGAWRPQSITNRTIVKSNRN